MTVAPDPQMLPDEPGRPPATLPEAERLDRLRLARSTNVGPRTYLQLLRRFGSAAEALEALPGMAGRGGKGDYRVCEKAEAEAEMAAGIRAGARLVLMGEADYPDLLAQIESPPPALWISGTGLAVVGRPGVSIVGARNASALGQRAARNLARDLGQLGYVIVSGLARGIDTAAHEASLDTGTIAVMAGGVDYIYPPENRRLAERIQETGNLISECPPGTEPTSRHFPRRNRLISGLSLGVVLIEAAARSGSLITARYALEQGREAMACPGAPEDPRTGGCNQLIRDGAALIRRAEDVLEALAGPRTLGLAEPGRGFSYPDDDFDDPADSFDFGALDDFDGAPHSDGELIDRVLQLLGPTPVEMDEIARQCGATPADLSLVLLELDLAGQIEIHPGGRISSVTCPD